MRTHEKIPSVIHDPGQVSSVAHYELLKAKGAIEQFVYSCSHSLRGPLKTITGLVNVMKDGEIKDQIDQNYFLNSILKTVSKMEFMLDDLQKFLFNSQQIIATQPINVHNVIDDLLGEYQSKISAEGISVVVAVEQLVPFYGDLNRFSIILSHLIANAIDFRDCSKNKMVIQIHANVTSASCTAQIHDNGIGIHKSVRPYIFNLFYRGSGNSVGSGIGLYIVNEVLNKIGGAITVNSIVNKESTFRVSIPNLVR